MERELRVNQEDYISKIVPYLENNFLYHAPTNLSSETLFPLEPKGVINLIPEKGKITLSLDVSRFNNKKVFSDLTELVGGDD